MLASLFIVQAVAPIIDPDAMALLAKNRDAMLALKGYRAECRTTVRYVDPKPGAKVELYDLATLVAAKPDRLRYDSWRLADDPARAGWKPRGAPLWTVVSDGQVAWIQNGVNYDTESPSPSMLATHGEPWTGFFAADASLWGVVEGFRKNGTLVSVRAIAPETLGGVRCDAVEIVERESGGAAVEFRVAVDLAPDGLVRRGTFAYSLGGRLDHVRTSELVRIERNPDLSGMRYAYTPPPGVALRPPRKEAPRLELGVPAPFFIAQDAARQAASIVDFRGKVVVLDFWASWCGPCVASMPHTNAVVARLQKEGIPVVALALDDAEEQDAFAAWVGKEAAKYPALRFVYSPKAEDVSGRLYRVTAIPTQVVVDASGTIRWSDTGYDGPTDDLERAIRAAAKG